LITIDLSVLGSELDALAKYLQLKLQVSIDKKGKMLLLEDSKAQIRTKDVKMYLEEFIYHKKFSEEYRIVVDHQIIKVLKPKASVKPKPPETSMWGVLPRGKKTI